MVHLKSLVAKSCQNIYSSRLLIILIPIGLSAFTHLWNLEGFPGIYRDEDHYLRKTMHVLRGLGPQEGPSELVSFPVHPYTHPYFGQLFLAGVLGIVGYPNSIHPTADPSSIKELFLVPRILMGILAVADTFFLYRITEFRYNRTVALIASILFAVMPITWMLRRVWLEPIQLPFILSSILLALLQCKLQFEKKSCGLVSHILWYTAWVSNLYKDSSIYDDSISRLYCLFCHQESKIGRTMVYSSTPDTRSMASICYLYRPV